MAGYIDDSFLHNISSVAYDNIILMIKVMFVCLGNICRSTMAEFLFKDMVAKCCMENKFYIASSATSRYEIGSPVHHGTAKKLREHGISCGGKRAVQLTADDYNNFDFIIAMETANIVAIKHLLKHQDPQNKVCRLLDYSNNPRDIADPWYTGNFEDTYCDVKEGLEAFIKYCKTNNLL